MGTAVVGKVVEVAAAAVEEVGSSEVYPRGVVARPLLAAGRQSRFE
jgi:predicted ribonuclease YlaK